MSRRRELASDQLRRILTVIPWIIARPGVELAEAAAHFGLTESQLTSELGVVFMVGVPPYSPDALVDVVIDDGRVWITYADFFRRPMKLTAGQGLALVAAGEALLALSAPSETSTLESALAKLSASLGVSGDAVDVRLGESGVAHSEALEEAVRTQASVEIDYYSFGRDELTSRVIEPQRVFAAGGAWYVEAYCTSAGAVRMFRLDRIAALAPTGQPVPDRPREAADEDIDLPAGTLCRIRLSPADSWVADHYDCRLIATEDDGSLTVDLRVYALAWLERLLLTITPDSEVIDGGNLGLGRQIRAVAARRILSRYRG